MSKRQKQGHLGPAFHHWLEHLERVEALLAGKSRKSPVYAVNEDLFGMKEESFQEMIPVDGALAQVVRSSVKYKMPIETMAGLAHHYEDEVNYLLDVHPPRLPHEYCTIVFEGFLPGANNVSGDLIVCLQDQTTDVDYPALGLKTGESFICANIAGYRPGGVNLLNGPQGGNVHSISSFPVEIHISKDLDGNVLYANAEKAMPTEAGKTTLYMVTRSVLIWMQTFNMQSLLREKTPGVAPNRALRNAPKRLRKRVDHPKFEHTILTLEVDAPEPQQQGISKFQPKKRLHQVRGFWRFYKKTGKRVWVEPHWRGDKELGVVRRDYEVTMHEEKNHAETSNSPA